MKSLLEMKNITKYFASTDVQAGDNVNFSVKFGEVHALVGENGAGKTTLMNILFGLVKADKGEIFINGERCKINHPNDAIQVGVSMVHQHFELIPSYTVAQNVFLGMEINTYGVMNQKKQNQQLESLSKKFGLPMNPKNIVRDLSVGMQQRVEILKTLARDAKILILDEPTSVLTPQEVKELITVIRDLTKKGITVIFITHKLVEVMEVADRVSVMRQGKMIGTKAVSETNIPELARMMVGREVLLRVNRADTKIGKPIFECQDVSIANSEGIPVVSHVSFRIHKGEIVGIAGVSGNGQTELVEAITGMCDIDGGSISLLGKEICDYSVRERRKLGMSHIPEDRMVVGLNLATNLDENLIVTQYSLPKFNKFGLMKSKPIREFASSIIKNFSIASAQPGEMISKLSGGNLQKIIVGRELSGNPEFIVANQPTRGLDVGSTEYVHQILMDSKKQGIGVLLVSVELDEILSLSDRILIFYRGRIQGEVNPKVTTEEEIGILMAGGKIGMKQTNKNL